MSDTYFQEAAEGSWGAVNSSEGPAHGQLQMDSEGTWVQGDTEQALVETRGCCG